MARSLVEGSSLSLDQTNPKRFHLHHPRCPLTMLLCAPWRAEWTPSALRWSACSTCSRPSWPGWMVCRRMCVVWVGTWPLWARRVTSGDVARLRSSAGSCKGPCRRPVSMWKVRDAGWMVWRSWWRAPSRWSVSLGRWWRTPSWWSSCLNSLETKRTGRWEIQQCWGFPARSGPKLPQNLFLILFSFSLSVTEYLRMKTIHKISSIIVLCL